MKYELITVDQMNNEDLSKEDPPKRNRKKRKGKMIRNIALLLALVVFVSGTTSIGTAHWITSNSAGVQQTASATASSDTATPVAYLSNTSNDIITAVDKAFNSIVEIKTESTSYSRYAGEFVTEGAGSGVVLSEDGYIITNNHVINGANTITVRLTSGKEYTAKLIGKDAETDLALLKIDASGLKAVTFADSSSIQVGQLAIAIGNPLGSLGGTVTEGIISAKDREITIDGQTMTLLQTSAAVNPGNSGGGLFDGNGNLVGIVNAKSSGSDIEGLAFAIPSNTVSEVINQLMDHGYVTGRPQIGISVVEVSNQQMARMYGVSDVGIYIAAVSTNNGLASGDRIVSIEGETIKSSDDVSAAVKKHKVGDVVSVVVVRDGQQKTVKVTLTEQGVETAAAKDSYAAAA